jgi:hypothetical protein
MYAIRETHPEAQRRESALSSVGEPGTQAPLDSFVTLSR